MAKIKAAKIINKFGKEFIVPLHIAKKKVRNEEIEDFEIVEVDRLLNGKKPETQSEFNRRMDNQGLKNNDVLKENIELTKQLVEVQKELNKLKGQEEIKIEDVIEDKEVKGEQSSEKTTLDLLKEEASLLGIEFAKNIGEETLSKRIEDFKNQEKEEIKIPETK